jgi:hypothetical protein
MLLGLFIGYLISVTYNTIVFFSKVEKLDKIYNSLYKKDFILYINDIKSTDDEIVFPLSWRDGYIKLDDILISKNFFSYLASPLEYYYVRKFSLYLDYNVMNSGDSIKLTNHGYYKGS